MNLNKREQKYLKKHLKKKTIEEIASYLKISPQKVIDYLKNHPKADKYRYLWEKERKKENKGNLKTRIANFNLKQFLKDNYLIVITLIGLVFLVYANSINNEFLSDDIDGILKNKNLDNISYYFESPYRIIRSFQPILYYVIVQIFGRIPAPFRISNILFHAGSTIVVFTIVYLLVNKMAAFMAASLVAVHPILIESIVWISGGGYCMYGFFLLLSILFYILREKNKNYLYLSLLSSLMAINVSEKAIVFPAILFLLSISYKIKLPNKKILIAFLVPAVIFAIMFGSKIPERIEWLKTTHYQEGILYNPLQQIPAAVSSYLQLIFWPKGLTLYHTEMRFGVVEFWLRFLITFLFLGSIAYSFFKKKYHYFFWTSLFIVALAPTLMPFGISWVVAERYAYLSSVAILILAAIFFERLNRVKNIKNIPLIFFCLIIIALGIKTIDRNVDWKNQDNLWLAAAKTSPNSHQNHNNLGDYYGRHGDYENAIKEFKLAVQINPRYADAYHNLANVYWQTGQTDLAIENYKKAAEINPSIWQSRQNLAAIYFNLGNYEEAQKELEKALAIRPDDANFHANMGIIYLKLGEREKAIESLNKALELNPSDVKTRDLLEMAQSKEEVKL